jgi:hypothetical protein
MKIAALVAGLCLGLTPVVAEHALAQTSTTKYITVDGEVLRYEPGRVIVIRGSDGRETVYNLAPTVAVPADMRVGRRVTLYTEPGEMGTTQVVTRVTTTSVTPEGNIKRTTEDTRTLPSGATTTTTTTTISGKVESYTAGKTLTILRNDGTRATYVINEKSMVPQYLVVGKTVSIVPLITNNENGELVIRTVTYVPVKPNN